MMGRVCCGVLLALAACSKQDEERSASPVAPTSIGPLHFTDVTARTGIDLTLTSGRTPSTQILEVKGGGLAALDYDRDGDVDLFFPNGATLDSPSEGPGCRLYRNDGGLRFTDVTQNAGLLFRRWGFGCAVADYDADGHQDVYVCCFGKNALLKNTGDGRFQDVTDAAGVGADGWSTAAAFGDVDGDGDLDLYVAKYLDFDPAQPPKGDVFLGVSVFGGPNGLPATPDVLYLNRGDGTFEDASDASGIRAVLPGFGLGVVILDFDGDGAQEIFVGNDSVPNCLFERTPEGKFQDVAARSDLATDADGHSHATMGIAIGDVDGNGMPDVITTSFMNDTDTLYLNQGELNFIDRTTPWGLGQITRPYLSWACALVDFDHDADEDLMIWNGHVYPKEITEPHGWQHDQTPELFERRAGEQRFRPVAAAIAGEWLAAKHCDRSAAFVDLDEDGDVDVVVTELNGKVRVLENDGARGPWLQVKLADRRADAKNRDGLGARVTLETPGAQPARQLRWNPGGASYQAAGPPRVHFGWPSGATSASIVVTWPDGAEQRVDAVAPNQVITVERRD